MGTIKCNEVRWYSDDNEVFITVEHTGLTMDYRQRYTWTVIVRGVIMGSGNDINSGVGGVVDAMEGLKAFSSYLEAWTEALRYGGESENRDLFPMRMEQFADQYHDELYMDTHYEEEL